MIGLDWVTYSSMLPGDKNKILIGTFPQNLRVGAGESTPLSQGCSSAVSWGRVWGYGENPNPRCLHSG